MSSTPKTSTTLDLACDLISRRSVTPEDAGCQTLVAERLEPLGFTIDPMPSGPVQNLWARRGKQAPLFVFAGHTDVVPPGPDYTWSSPPFKPTIADGVLTGRGSADMKTGIAAFVTAVERFIARHPNHKGSIALLLTSNEEGDAVGGTPHVIAQLHARNEKMDYCLVGEATASSTAGDTIKNGRRGSLTCKLKVKGVQGHVAYPDRAKNPIHAFAPALSELVSTVWDKGNQFFGPTTMQFSNLNSGTGADNVIPSELDAILNFRFCTESTPEKLQSRSEDILNRYGVAFEATWRVSGQPFLTEPGPLTAAAIKAVEKVTGVTAKLSTSGGTSDARFIAPTGAQVIELGMVNTTIHQVNEQVKVSDIDTLSSIYESILQDLLAPS